MSPRINFNDGEEILYGDLNNISAAIIKDVLDRIGYELGNRQINFVFQGSFAVTYVNATTVQVAAGTGMQNDSSQVDPEPVQRLLYLASNTNLSLSAADPTNNRIDIVCAKAAFGNITSVSRNIKDANTLAVAATSVVTETDWAATVAVTTGTPSGSPAVPATPAGYIKLAEILITASSGMSGQAAITDKRTRYKKPSSNLSIASKTANYTVDLDDELLLGNATGGAFQFTLPDAALCSGKEYTAKKTDSSANKVTLGTTSAQLIDGVTTQTLDAQYSALTLVSDGTGWNIV